MSVVTEYIEEIKNMKFRRVKIFPFLPFITLQAYTTRSQLSNDCCLRIYDLENFDGCHKL